MLRTVDVFGRAVTLHEITQNTHTEGGLRLHDNTAYNTRYPVFKHTATTHTATPYAVTLRRSVR